ncbi:hypothetical protein [uncultured Roseibium sp.]|uniref:hypothetical protein n=1 Tax=uncultured Roseibium sp. TaxID=1936171 RepID=UPI0026036941|nr:hypothetical protein [uncultured Roseibium sp.]
MLQELSTKSQPISQLKPDPIQLFDGFVMHGLTLPKDELLAEVWNVTPALAEHILQKYHNKNRKFIVNNFKKIVREMDNGHWRLTSQGVSINSDGDLDDGQHRMHAIVATGTAAKMLVVVGADPEGFKVLDTGRKRQAADVLSIDGVVNPKNMAALVAFILALKRGNMSAQVSTSEISDFTAEHYEPLHEAVLFGAKICKHLKGSQAAYSTFCYLVLTESSHADKLPSFVDGVAFGENIKRGDPVYTLRNMLNSGRISGSSASAKVQQVNHFLRTWEKYLLGETFHHYRAMPIGSNLHRVR